MPLPQHNLEELQQQILRYCLRIASSKWEAEDLAQDVLLKVYQAIEADAARVISNAYLYRIATNAWKDKLKRASNRIISVDLEELAATSGNDANLSTRELLEELAHRLTPRSMVILLLMDVLAFTAKETAEFLAAAEGAIQVALGRARLRLRKLAQETRAEAQSQAQPGKQHSDSTDIVPFDFEALVAAFKRRDPKAICQAYLGLAKQQFRISKLIWVNGKLAFYLEDPDGNRFMIKE